MSRFLAFQGMNQGRQALLALYQGAQESKLGAATIKVMSYAVNVEVTIPFQKIGEEANAAFEGEELARQHQAFPFRR
jgi:hypothetical protein